MSFCLVWLLLQETTTIGFLSVMDSCHEQYQSQRRTDVPYIFTCAKVGTKSGPPYTGHTFGFVKVGLVNEKI